MAKQSTNVRLEPAEMDLLKRLSTIHGQSITQFTTDALLEKMSAQDKRDFLVGEKPLYPVHLLNSELMAIINQILKSNSGNGFPGNKLTVRVRRSGGGFGFDIELDFFSLPMNTELTSDISELPKSRRWSMVVNPNWYLVQLYDHWFSSDGNPECAVFKNTTRKEVQKVIDKIITTRLEGQGPTLNPIFETDDWTLIYQQSQQFFIASD